MSEVMDDLLTQLAEYHWKEMFLNEAMNAVKNSLERGITPDYLFVDPSWLEPGKLMEFCGLKVWVVRLPEDKKIIAVGVHSCKEG